MRLTARAAACLTLGTLGVGCSSSDNGETKQPPIAGYPIDPNAPTTLQKTVKANTIAGAPLAKKDLEQVSRYGQYGYGGWTDGGPLAADKRSDLMADGYQYPPAAGQTLLANFFTFTDIHITDKESPSQLIYMQPLAEHGMIVHQQDLFGCRRRLGFWFVWHGTPPQVVVRHRHWTVTPAPGWL